ncbi:MAG: SAM-dependent methyltransferase [Candidatus Lokiarchaeota archaeon]|nr:SAM-dependent methyltransferase [Candidatus Lokiarchaeota archaeon]
MDDEVLDAGSQKDAIPFTAKLTAFHRMAETERKNPLFKDHYAKMLIGDMTKYSEEHRYSISRDGYTIARTYYIDEYLLKPWAKFHDESQIVLLGAGLDARAYRFRPLEQNSHIIFELDFPVTIQYKTKILKDEIPLCNLVRIPTDISKHQWVSQLFNNGFSKDIPSFWIMEGLLYYVPQDASIFLLKTISDLSTHSELFADVCVPPIAGLKFGPFTRHFKWGIEKEDIHGFFQHAGWNVTCAYAEEFDQGRDVGQKGMIFVHGHKSEQNNTSVSDLVRSDREYDLSRQQLQARAIILLKKSPKEIEYVLSQYRKNPEDGIEEYHCFIKEIYRNIKQFTTLFRDISDIARISPRILADPFLKREQISNWTKEELDSHIYGFLIAILQFLYCTANNLDGSEYANSSLHDLSTRNESDKLTMLSSIISFINSELK